MVIVEHLTSPNSPKTAASVKNGSGSRSARNVPHSNNRTNRRTKSPTNKESPSPKQSPSRVKTQKHGSLTRVKSSGKVQTVLRTPSPKETAKTFDTCCLSCAVIFLLVVIIGGSVLFWMRFMPDEFNIECIRRHNYIRSLHKAPPLIYDSDLARAAQFWADSMAAKMYLELDPNKYYGENVCQLYLDGVGPAGLQIRPSGQDAADQFYKLHDFFPYLTPEASAGCCYQFTQMVWIHTDRLGCAYNLSNGPVFVSCKYYPPGNIVGQFAANVMPIYSILPPNPIPQIAAHDNSTESIN